MRRLALALALVVALSLALVAWPPVAAQQDPEARLVQLINEYRAANGRSPLSVDTTLTAAARWLSNDMLEKDYFSHTDSLGRSLGERLQDFGFQGYAAGENIFMAWSSSQQATLGISEPEDVVTAWRNSPGHNAVMLTSYFTHIGVGRACGWWGSYYKCYWTADFGAMRSSSTPTPTPSPSHTPSPTPTPTPSPTPTPTPTPTLVVEWGDVDCDNGVTAIDALLILRHTVGLPTPSPGGCPALGHDVLAEGVPVSWGDIDLDGDVDAVDALLVLRKVVNLPASFPLQGRVTVTRL
jgi:uncharacterized protein YkwD